MKKALNNVFFVIRNRYSFIPFLLSFCCLAAAAAQTPPPTTVLFENVKVFDGKSSKLSAPTNVLVRGNKIESISAAPIPVNKRADTLIINGEGRTLMPGLIDAHFHMMMTATPLHVALTGEPGYLNLIAAREAKNTLLRGFTSVRDMAGPVFSIKRAIDEQLIEGPRIWPSGAMISQTSGHGDYRSLNELPRTANSHLHHSEVTGGAAIADGVDEVLRRTREQLMLGASQVKLAAGGGVSSNYDPLDVAQYTEAEFRAAVDAAENWGTYVSVHAYTPRAIQTAINAGVKVIDHAQLMDETTAKLAAKKGVWLSLQPFLDDEDANPQPEGSANRAKQLQVTQGTDTAFALAKKYNIKVAWGTDSLFDAKLTARQGAQLAKMIRWYTPAEVLMMATSGNAELLALSGPRTPYPGKLGVIEPGALADLLLVDGDPLADINLVADPEKNFLVIMKDGKIAKQIMRKSLVRTIAHHLKRIAAMQTRALIAAVFCLTLVGCDKPAPAGPSPVQVSVQQPERRSVDVERDFIGEVAAVEEAEIRSKVNGRVISVEFEEGSLVKQGQPLFRIDSDSLLAALNEAKANVSKAQADQTKVLADQARYKTLVEKGTISRQAYDDIINKVAQAKAALDTAQAQLNQAQTMMQESAIVSPYNGRIGRAQIKIGELVTANQTLMATVSTTESVRVDFALSERDYLQLVRPILESNQPRPLLPVKLLLADGSLYPESGLITFSDRTISSDTGTFAVAATFPNPQEVLRPGMFGRIRAVVKQIDDALLIPNRAVQEVLDRNFISLVDSSGTVEQREVKLGAQANGFVQIISGLSEGEQVIVDGHHKARPGMQVKAIAIDSAAAINDAAINPVQGN